jgi:hypothetical protein
MTLALLLSLSGRCLSWNCSQSLRLVDHSVTVTAVCSNSTLLLLDFFICSILASRHCFLPKHTHSASGLFFLLSIQRRSHVRLAVSVICSRSRFDASFVLRLAVSVICSRCFFFVNHSGLLITRLLSLQYAPTRHCRLDTSCYCTGGSLSSSDTQSGFLFNRTGGSLLLFDTRSGFCRSINLYTGVGLPVFIWFECPRQPLVTALSTLRSSLCSLRLD